MQLVLKRGREIIKEDIKEDKQRVFARNVGLRFGHLTFDTQDDRRIQPTAVDGFIYCGGLWWSDVDIYPHGKGVLLTREDFTAGEVRVTDDHIMDYHGLDHVFDAWRHTFCKECGLGPWAYEDGILTAEINDGARGRGD